MAREDSPGDLRLPDRTLVSRISQSSGFTLEQDKRYVDQGLDSVCRSLVKKLRRGLGIQGYPHPERSGREAFKLTNHKLARRLLFLGQASSVRPRLRGRLYEGAVDIGQDGALGIV